jgi:hypothetical protein
MSIECSRCRGLSDSETTRFACREALAQWIERGLDKEQRG